MNGWNNIITFAWKQLGICTQADTLRTALLNNMKENEIISVASNRTFHSFSCGT